MKAHTNTIKCMATYCVCSVQTLTWNRWMVRCEQVLKVLDHNQQQQGCSTEEQKNNTTLACQAKLMLIQNEVEEGRQQKGAAHGTHATHQAHHIPQHCKCLQTVHPHHGIVCRNAASLQRGCTQSSTVRLVMLQQHAGGISLTRQAKVRSWDKAVPSVSLSSRKIEGWQWGVKQTKHRLRIYYTRCRMGCVPQSSTGFISSTGYSSQSFLDMSQ